jgi:hypothetical protein
MSAAWHVIKLLVLLLWNVTLARHWFSVCCPVLSPSGEQLSVLVASYKTAWNILLCPIQEARTDLCSLMDNTQPFMILRNDVPCSEWHICPQTAKCLYIWEHQAPLETLWKWLWSTMPFYMHSITGVFIILKQCSCSDFPIRIGTCLLLLSLFT